MKCLKFLIPFVLVFSLVFSCFVFPISAASSGWTNVEVTTSMEYGLLHIYNTETGITFVEPDAFTGSTGTNCEWKFVYNSSGYNNVRAFCRPVDKPMSLRVGDVVQLPYIEGGFGGWFGGANNIASIRWTVIAYDDTNSFPRWDTQNNDFVSCITGNDEWKDLNGGGNWNYTIPATTFEVVRDCDYAYLGLEIVFWVEQNFSFSMNKKTFTVGYGNPNSLEAPNFKGPDTSKADELTNAEDILMEDTSQGREDAESIMSVDSFSDNLNKLMPGILAATQIIDLCFDTIAPLQTLVYIGLALGFVSFVLGTINMVAGSVRSANARKERDAKNDAYREKVFNENKRYHDAMISRRRK